MRIKWLMLSGLLFVLIFSGCSKNAQSFRSHLPDHIQRTWIGPEYWANPLQDWRLHDGRIECVSSGGDRNVFLLTQELASETGTLKMSVRCGRLKDDQNPLDQGWIGFKIGVRGQFNDYRDSAVRGAGLPAGMTTGGQLFIGGLDVTSDRTIKPPFKELRLQLSIQPEGEKYKLKLTAFDKNSSELASIERTGINANRIPGGVALVCSRGNIPKSLAPLSFQENNWGFRPGTGRGGNVRFWFADWQISGSKVRAFPERTFGPILFSQYTLSDSVLKMTAQMPPIAPEDGKQVALQIKKKNSWKTISKAPIDAMARTATFRVENWDSRQDVPYRLSYKCYAGPKAKTYYFTGTIRKEPWDKNEIVVAAFTGNNDLGFPNTDIVKQLKEKDPDFMFFSGDQIYEGVAGYGTQRSPVDKATLDYLRKWYLYGWAYRDLLRNRPTVSIPDDHDVYHGNLWGAGGKATDPGLTGQEAQDTGGYKMPPEWVNMVQRTQTSHLPDPYDPTPVKQGIGVYYCNLNYAGISFAIVEDRKFKSAPKTLLPKAKVRNGWAQNPNFNAKKEADVPGAVLLGQRQLKFLRHWAADWSHHTWMKVVLSQTIFANVATLPKKEMSDANVPKLRILPYGQYPPDDMPVADMDSDGWPQSGRNRALREMRRAFALHIAGDQHLGSTIQYGIDDWHDAGYAFCVPAISNVWPRRWFPSIPGKNRKPGAPKYTGDFEDGFGNKITVYAVSNPVFTGLKPSRLYDRAPGYGIVRFDRNTRDITIECWPRLSDPTKTKDGQYRGWPIRINQLDNYGRAAQAYLPTLEIDGMQDPVIQVIDEDKNEVVYTLRIKDSRFSPKVFKSGTYTIRVGDPDLNKMKTLTGIEASLQKGQRTLKIKF